MTSIFRSAGLAKASAALACVGALAAAVPAAATGAFKFYIMVDLLNGADQLVMDRWYMTYHAQQMHRSMRAWQRNYISFRSYNTPPEADIYPIWHGRLSEIDYDSYADFQEGRANNPFLDILTAPPGGWQRGAAILNAAEGAITPTAIFRSEPAAVPINPQEVYLQGATPAKETPYFRWVVFFRYPKGVSQADGDKWFLGTHVKEVAKLPGLRRYIGYRVIDTESKYPRVEELWFDDYKAWRKVFIGTQPAFTKPPWGGTRFPFADAISTFVGENPDIDFMNDKRVIP
ncbi:hypothetical protein [Phenylobacterium sp.]|jgi:hypothetical protein|uniref:hypothetical protein n=1 Tax=Phenylobacterium sp. TaxID=1871053 RepID=UPI002E352DDE|nr:hypothetical protein [Phenylobacterium sp.]HEX3366838.1 hypothetical protein [Phenylobacterium sp.]